MEAFVKSNLTYAKSVLETRQRVEELLVWEASELRSSTPEQLDAMADTQLKQLREASYAFLLEQGFSEVEIAENLDPQNDLAVILAAQLVLEDNLGLPKTELRGFTADVGDCLLRAFGVKSLLKDLGTWGMARIASRSFLLRFAGVAATRLGLGPIATLITTGLFVDCMLDRMSEQVMRDSDRLSRRLDSERNSRKGYFGCESRNKYRKSDVERVWRSAP